VCRSLSLMTTTVSAWQGPLSEPASPLSSALCQLCSRTCRPLLIVHSTNCTCSNKVAISPVTSCTRPDLGGGVGPRPLTNSIQVNQLQKIAPRMHKKTRLFELKNRKIFWGGGTTPSHTLTPSAPFVPRSWRLRHSTSASGATATGLMGSYSDAPVTEIDP